MSIVAALILNVVLVLLISGVVGFFASKYDDDGADGVAAGVGVFWILGVLSFWGWFIFVVLHFVAKVW